ncbi:hypothetical protein [Oleidesulfovibrio alaskensis]|jgi:septal ring factor EnvC (AmiA/AmiB activator)|uniref:hypothetical protein n=1 Tax=Oleidesulfovibrio alaskensis TaxID=58180 RepID=UPI001A39AFB9|nr:hypothetical protein [Oleidesulfovibrio alaskensis]MBL3581076.1 hypothetical protein [Oleidesulfovibrio alaskensis]
MNSKAIAYAACFVLLTMLGCTPAQRSDVEYLQAYMDATNASLRDAAEQAARLNEALSRRLAETEQERHAIKAELEQQQEQLRRVKLAIKRAKRMSRRKTAELQNETEALRGRQEQLELNIRRLALNLSRELDPYSDSGDFSQVESPPAPKAGPAALSTSSTVPETDKP